jgi:hypothetical protein
MWESITQTVVNSADHTKAQSEQVKTVTIIKATLTYEQLAISETNVCDLDKRQVTHSNIDRCQITEYSKYRMVLILTYLTIYCYHSYAWAVQLTIIPFGYLLYLLV